MKILVIEDDAGLNRGLAFALSQDGYELLTAASVREGLRIFHKEQPDGVTPNIIKITRKELNRRLGGMVVIIEDDEEEK